MKTIRAAIQCTLVMALTLPLVGATAYRDFYPLELDTRELQVVIGYVIDEFNNRPIRDAHVQLNGVDGNSQGTDTDDSGFFRFSELDPAFYPFAESTLDVTHNGNGYRDAGPYSISAGVCPIIKLQSKTVILMHGFGGSFEGTWGGNTGAFATTMNSLGFKVVGVDVDGFLGNILPVSYAEDKMRASLDLQCHQLGIQSYDVIAHSMGGLVSRSYLAKSHGRDRINKLVMLATPNHGSFLAAEALIASHLLDKVLNLLSGGLCCGGAVGLLADQTALKDLAPGSSFLNTINYNSLFNLGELLPCKGEFNENSDNGLTTLYSIAGSHPDGWFSASRVLLGCWWVPSDGVVLKSRAFYHDSFVCTDDGLGCPVHHKEEFERIAKSACMAIKVGQLLVDGTWGCTDAGKLGEGGYISRLPIIEGVVQPGASFQDSTLINALSMVDFLCVAEADSLVYTLESPSGQLIDPAFCAGNPDMEYARGFQSAFYTIQQPEAGWWRHHVATVGSAEPDTVLIIASFDGEVTLASNVESGIDPDADFTLYADFTDAGYAIPTGTVAAEVTRPAGAVEQIDLYDDGMGGDGVPGDGIYTVAYPAAGEAGTYSFVFRAETDPQSPQSETREAMQVATAAWLPDPAVSAAGLVVENTSASIGGLLGMSVIFTNMGSATADSVSVTISNVSYGVALADTMLLNLAPGQSVELEAEWLAVAEGNFNLRAAAEMYGDDIESNQANNGSEVGISVYIPGEVSSVPDEGGGDENPEAGTTSRILLYNSYPNPLATGSTSIRFTVPSSGAKAELAVFDIRGRRIRTILAEVLSPGEYVRTWDGSDQSGRQVASGVYFCRLQVAGQVQIKKLVVLR